MYRVAETMAEIAWRSAFAAREGSAVHITPDTVAERGTDCALHVPRIQQALVVLDAGDIAAKLARLVNES